MTLTAPWWLLMLLPIAFLALIYVVQQRRRSRYAVRFAALPMLERLIPDRPGWRRHLPTAALLLAFATVVVAAARPQVEAEVPREQATVVVAVDVSRSMQATDVAPNRIEAATTAAAAFIRQLPDEFNVAVVTFSGRAAVLSPPSTDHARAAESLSTVRLENSTAIGEAVFTSLEAIRAQAALTGQESVPARVVLLSDGSNTTGREPAEAATAAAAAGVPVSTIAYGTPEGEIRSEGRTVGTPVDAAVLDELATASGGIAYTAENSAELSAVYDDIGSAIGYQTEQVDVTSYVLALALTLGLIAAGLSQRWFARLT